MDIHKQPLQKVLINNIKKINKSIVIEDNNESTTRKISDNPKKKKKIKSKRCDFDGCRRKLKLTDMECRCSYIFCTFHRLPEQHECGYNFRKFNKDRFAKQVGLGGGEVPKMEKI